MSLPSGRSSAWFFILNKIWYKPKLYLSLGIVRNQKKLTHMTTQTKPTIEAVIIAAFEKGLKVEAFSTIDNRDTFIGISSRNYQWDWFEGHTYYTDPNYNFYFTHTYYQKSGWKCSSIMHKIHTELRYAEILGVPVSFAVFGDKVIM